MKRAPIMEDWSCFNRAVLEVADNLPRAARTQSVPQQPKREAAEQVPDLRDGGDTYGLIDRNKRRAPDLSRIASGLSGAPKVPDIRQEWTPAHAARSTRS